MTMKAVIPNRDAPPCIVYWTGRVKLHVGVVTYCKQSRDASAGVLQVPADTPCCEECEAAVKERDFPKART